MKALKKTGRAVDTVQAYRSCSCNCNCWKIGKKAATNNVKGTNKMINNR